MQLQLQSFPVVYFYATCEEHKCKVSIHLTQTSSTRTDTVIGGEITSMRCEEGLATCSKFWVLNINGPGTITITS